jgi:hypothetical protein
MKCDIYQIGKWVVIGLIYMAMYYCYLRLCVFAVKNFFVAFWIVLKVNHM